MRTRDAADVRRRALVEYLRRFAWRPVPVMLAISGFFALRRGADVNHAAPSPAAALAEAMTARGLACTERDVVWAAGPSGLKGAILGGARGLVRARKGVREGETPELHDLYLVEARLSPEGKVLEVGSEWNLTNTADVDESVPELHGAIAAYTTSRGGAFTALHALNLNGRPAEELADFTRMQRTQVALMNLQKTGQTSGIVDNAYFVEYKDDAGDPHTSAEKVDVAWREDGKLTAKIDDHLVVLDPVSGAVLEGDKFVRPMHEELAKPGNLVTWAVDRVRDMPWFGDEKMQWLKAIVMEFQGWVDEKFASAATNADMKKELGGIGGSGETPNVAPDYANPETGWPPGPLAPPASPPLDGEGKWITIDKDPFVTQSAGAPAAFLTTFLRPNPKRLDIKVFITLWDPRQIALHMEAGTVEPVSATGERGPGQIPREPEVMRHVVAAFNGGFQAQHGEFGMQANRILYLMPKPYAATVMEMRDGSTAFGSWPNSASVPEEVLSYRQNLTALVDTNGAAGPAFNPWQRTWWGGTPPGWADTIHTARSAICLTKDNFVAYLYSLNISPDDLARAAVLAQCTYAIHLDMNPGHAGFEFYNVQPANTWKALGRPYQKDWEDEGKVSGMPDWMFRSRRMIRGMWHMNFPRYIGREGRDFFYLTTRTVLPGAPLEADGKWRVEKLPQHGFPYALATTTVQARAGLKLNVLRVDPRAVLPSGSLGTNAETPTVLTLQGPALAPGAPSAPAVSAPHRPGDRRHAPALPTASHAPEAPAPIAGALTLWYSGSAFAIGPAAPAANASALTAGLPTTSSQLAGVRAAVGISNEDGMLNWVELPADAPADAFPLLTAQLDKMGCSSRMYVLPGARALLGGTLDLNAAPASGHLEGGARLVRGNAPGAHAMFEDNTPIPYNVWQPLQSQRVKLPGK